MKISIFCLFDQIPTDVHPRTKKSALETVLTVWACSCKYFMIHCWSHLIFIFFYDILVFVHYAPLWSLSLDANNESIRFSDLCSMKLSNWWICLVSRFSVKCGRSICGLHICVYQCWYLIPQTRIFFDYYDPSFLDFMYLRSTCLWGI